MSRLERCAVSVPAVIMFGSLALCAALLWKAFVEDDVPGAFLPVILGILLVLAMGRDVQAVFAREFWRD